MYLATSSSTPEKSATIWLAKCRPCQNFAEPRSFVDDYQRWVGIALKNAPVVLGGSAFTTYPEEMLEHTGATLGMTGQAMKIIDLNEGNKDLLCLCLEDWSDDVKESG